MQHFDLCVIGSGSGNSLITPDFDGWSVALVDGAPKFGGTCLNAGCIPTKMFSVAADVAEQARTASRLGVDVTGVRARWADIRDRVFGRIDSIVAQGEAYRRDSRNVTLFREYARFAEPGILAVGDEQITADQFVLATGSRPRLPNVPGLDDPELSGLWHTSESIMRLDELPARLVIVGGGVVAVEFAHIFAGLGSEVTIVHRGQRLLREADEWLGERFTHAISELVTVRLGQRITGFTSDGRGGIQVDTIDADGVEYFFEGDQALIAIGRIPNSDTLNVEAAGIPTDSKGRVIVDTYQRVITAGSADGDEGSASQDKEGNRAGRPLGAVWALGDICSPRQLKHVANHEMRVVQHNLLHPNELIESDHRFIPQAVFSDPQAAWVGLNEEEAAERGPYVTSVRGYDSVAYGWALEDPGIHAVKLIATPDGTLLGAHILGPQAAILIQPLIQALSTGLSVPAMARGQYWIHPALTEIIENALLDLGSH